MAVAYTIDPERRLIYNRVSGPVIRGVLDVVREANTRDARFDTTFDINSAWDGCSSRIVPSALIVVEGADHNH